jgi:hypothetical protein
MGRRGLGRREAARAWGPRLKQNGPIVLQQPTVQRSATVVGSALMLLVHRIGKAMPDGPALDRMARPLLMRRGGHRKMAGRQPFTRKMKAARSPHFETGGKRCRASPGAEGAQRGAPAGAFSNRGRGVNLVSANRNRSTASRVLWLGARLGPGQQRIESGT